MAAPGDSKAFKAFSAGEREQLRWLETNTRTLICDRCWVYLKVPVTLTSSDWETWKHSSVDSYHPYTDYPFLVGLVSRIDNFFKDHPSPPIEIGPIACPYCSETLSMKEDFSPKCPECGSGDMQFTGGGIASVKGDWPPVI